MVVSSLVSRPVSNSVGPGGTQRANRAVQESSDTLGKHGVKMDGNTNFFRHVLIKPQKERLQCGAVRKQEAAKVESENETNGTEKRTNTERERERKT